MRCIAIGVALAATPRLGCRGVASPATGGWPRAASCQDKEHLGVTLARASARTKIIHTPGRQNPSLDHRLCKAVCPYPWREQLPINVATRSSARRISSAWKSTSASVARAGSSKGPERPATSPLPRGTISAPTRAPRPMSHEAGNGRSGARIPPPPHLEPSRQRTSRETPNHRH